MKSSLESRIVARTDVKGMLAALRGTVLPKMLALMPFMKRNSLVLLYGSVAKGNALPGSDIDVLLLLPESVRKRHRRDIYKARRAILRTGPVEISFPFTLEDLSRDKLWQRDMLVSALNEASAVYDPEGRFPRLYRYCRKYPRPVLRQKLLSAAWRLLRIRQLIDDQKRRDNHVEVALLRGKFLKLSMIALLLKTGRTFNGKHLQQDMRAHKDLAGRLREIDRLTAKIVSNSFESGADVLLRTFLRDCVSKSLLPEKFVSAWEEWPTERLTYKIDYTLL